MEKVKESRGFGITRGTLKYTLARREIDYFFYQETPFAQLSPKVSSRNFIDQTLYVCGT